MLTQNFAQHKQLLAARAAQIDRLNSEIKQLSNAQKQEADALIILQRRAKERSDRIAKVSNLRRLLEDRRRIQQQQGRSTQQNKKLVVGEAETHIPSITAIVEASRKLPPGNPDNASQALENLPREMVHLVSGLPLTEMRPLLSAYEHNNATLAQISSSLQKRSAQLEQLYRKVVALSTGVPEDKVDESLPLLVAAVESERGGLGFGREEVGRVRDFLVKVEGVGSESQYDDMEQTPRLRLHQQQQMQHQQQMGHMGGSRGLMGPPELPV